MSEERGNVGGYDVVAYTNLFEKGYRVRLPGKPYEVSVEQAKGEGMWYGPVVLMTNWSDDPEATDSTPYPEDARTYAVLLIGVVVSVFADMLMHPDVPVSVARFTPLYDRDT